VAVFVYNAVDGSRRAVRGTVTGDTPRQARDALRSRGLLVKSLTEQKRQASRRWLAGFTFRSTASQWAHTVHELAILLRAGIPLLEALDTVTQQHRGRFRTALVSVRDQVASGASLAAALAKQPDVFDPLSIHMVEVGENSGNLEHVLHQLAQFQQKYLRLKDRVLTALLYPTFLLLFGLAATIFLMTFVMPPLLDNLQESVDKLPLPTRVVKAFSDLLVNHWLVLGIGVVVFFAVVSALLRTKAGRRFRDRLILRLPLIGPMATKQAVSRAAIIISTLCRSGVVLTKALELAARSTRNVLLQEALDNGREAVGAGQDVAAALERAEIFPPLALRIFSVGQESGQLEEMLERLAIDYEEQVATVSERLTALLEPVLIIVLATLVGFVLLATILRAEIILYQDSGEVYQFVSGLPAPSSA